MRIRISKHLPHVILMFGLAPWSSAEAQKACYSDNICGKGEVCTYGRCIPGCRTSSACSGGRLCVNNTCTYRVCTPGVSRSCYDGSRATKNVGTCRAGVQYCLATGRGWSLCMQQQLPQPETCDRRDDDCDGRVDNGLTCYCTPGDKRMCYSGPSRTRGVGACKTGIQYCERSHAWGACLGQQVPTQEACGDRKDNDCDGQVDEGCLRGIASGPVLGRMSMAPSRPMNEAGHRPKTMGRITMGGFKVQPMGRLEPALMDRDRRERTHTLSKLKNDLASRISEVSKRLGDLRRNLDATRERVQSLEQVLRRR